MEIPSPVSVFFFYHVGVSVGEGIQVGGKHLHQLSRLAVWLHSDDSR